MAGIGSRRAKHRTEHAEAETSLSSGGTSLRSVAAAPEQAVVDYAQIGEHVGTVLEAAKAAAEKIMQQAALDAKQIRSDAQLQVRVSLEEAQKQAERADVEATRLVADAKRHSDKVREEADAYAAGAREAAGAEAAVLIGNAERQATDGVHVAQRHKRTLDRKIEATEERVRQLVCGVRELASSLEELIPATPAATRELDDEADELPLPERLAQDAAAAHHSPLRLPARPGHDDELFATESTRARSRPADQSGGW
jgi:hypothetical protein